MHSNMTGLKFIILMELRDLRIHRSVIVIYTLLVMTNSLLLKMVIYSGFTH